METNPDLGIINKKSIETLIKELQYLSDEVLSSLNSKKTDLSNIDENLGNYLSQNKTMIDDLTALYEKVKTDEKLKVKIKEIEINQIQENTLIAKIDDLKKASDSYSKVNNNISVELLNNSNEIKNKSISFYKLLQKKESEVIKSEKKVQKELENKINDLQDFKSFNNKYFMIAVLLTGFSFGIITTLSLLFTRLEYRELFYLFQKVFS
jgi:hypothetical protein